jgi:hypothetical protein
MHGAVVEFLREKISSNFAMLSLLVATVSGFSLAFFGAPFFVERKWFEDDLSLKVCVFVVLVLDHCDEIWVLKVYCLPDSGLKWFRGTWQIFHRRLGGFVLADYIY